MKGEGGVGGLEMKIVNGKWKKTLNCFLECWDKLKLIKIETWDFTWILIDDLCANIKLVYHGKDTKKGINIKNGGFYKGTLYKNSTFISLHFCLIWVFVFHLNFPIRQKWTNAICILNVKSCFFLFVLFFFYLFFI